MGTRSGSYRYKPSISNIKKYNIKTKSECIDLIHEKYVNKLFNYIDTENKSNNVSMNDYLEA